MKKLLIISVLCCIISCDKVFQKKYFVEIDKNFKSEVLGDDFKTDIKPIRAESIKDAYKKAYSNFMVSKEVAEGTRSKKLDTKVLGFRLLDEDKKDITSMIPEKSKDSIHKIVNEATAHISKNLKKDVFGENAGNSSKLKYDSVEVKNLKSKTVIEKDEFSEKYFYTPKNMPKYRDSNYLGFYFSGSKDKSSTLHFLMQYSNEDWLFVESIQIKIDDKVYNFIPENVETKVISGGVIEWSDDHVNINDDFVKAFWEAKKVKYRLNGIQFYKDYTLTENQISKIKENLKLYRYLK